MSNFLTVEKAAAQAGFSVRHFRRFIVEDSIPAKKFGGHKVFILASDLQKWMDAHPGKKPINEGSRARMRKSG